MVPRSNCKRDALVGWVRYFRSNVAFTYINAGRKIQIRRKLRLETKVVQLGIKAAFAAENNLVLEQRGKAIAVILGDPSLPPPTCFTRRAVPGPRPVSGVMLVDLDVSKERQNDVGYSKGLCDVENDGAFDNVAGAVMSGRLI